MRTMRTDDGTRLSMRPREEAGVFGEEVPAAAVSGGVPSLPLSKPGPNLGLAALFICRWIRLWLDPFQEELQ
jgi:hypothetical protein